MIMCKVNTQNEEKKHQKELAFQERQKQYKEKKERLL